MANVDEGRREEACNFCRQGRVIARHEEIAFRQMTDKGYVYCRVTVPVGRCNRCGAGSIGEDATRIMDEAVRRAYDALP